jgi:hypothetical protein
MYDDIADLGTNDLAFTILRDSDIDPQIPTQKFPSVRITATINFPTQKPATKSPTFTSTIGSS